MLITRKRPRFNAATHATDLPKPEVRALSYVRSATIKSLYWSHRGIQFVGFLWALGMAASIALGVMVFEGKISSISEDDDFLFGSAFLLAGLFALLAVLGCCFRGGSWGRVCGLLFSILCLAYFPYGTAVGILGLIIFYRAGQLYGEKRFSGADIVEEHRHRKQNFGA